MKDEIFLTCTATELKNLMKEAVKEATQEKTDNEQLKRTFSIAGTAKELGRSHTTIKHLIQSGKLTAIDGGRRITAQAINRYLGRGNEQEKHL